VHQRLTLKQKSEDGALSCHQLVMTATPIPRSLAMCAYGELDNSIIDELPPGRTPVKTIVLPDSRREEVIERIRQACINKKQIYWVCTLIEESEQLQCQAAEKSAEELMQAIPNANIALIHGRLSSQDKVNIMARFKAGEVDLLVATTVIEVGVNVPNASLMVIENPERLGLAQLHQLRGRVGRGAIESFCLLLYHPPLSAQSKARLKVMRESNDGFVVAEEDLALRGPGELLGTRQTGDIAFRIADLQCHASLIEHAQDAANILFAQADTNTLNALIKRWLPQGEQYAQV
jgi:ATP-dependent DNA helicase RecG